MTNIRKQALKNGIPGMKTFFESAINHAQHTGAHDKPIWECPATEKSEHPEFHRVILSPEEDFHLDLFVHNTSMPNGRCIIHSHKDLCSAVAITDGSYETKYVQTNPIDRPLNVDVQRTQASVADGNTLIDPADAQQHGYIHSIGFRTYHDPPPRCSVAFIRCSPR